MPKNLPCVRPRFEAGPTSELLTFLANLGIVVLGIINLVFICLGVGAIVIATRLDAEIDRRQEIMDLLGLVDLGSFTLKELINAIVVALIICGVFTIITSLLGGIGAFFAIRLLLVFYLVIVIICVLLELYVLSLWIDLLNKLNNNLRGLFNDLLEEYKGPVVADIYSIGWDFVFILFDCCGVEPVTVANNDFETLPTKWWSTGAHATDVIPTSCCHGASVTNYLSYTNSNCTVNLESYHTNGCYDIFDEVFTRLASAAISVITVLCIIEGVAIFFTVVIIIAVSARQRVGLAV